MRAATKTLAFSKHGALSNGFDSSLKTGSTNSHLSSSTSPKRGGTENEGLIENFLFILAHT
jgi:hypothetical protein